MRLTVAAATVALLAAGASVPAHAQCTVNAGGLVFDLSKANNGSCVSASACPERRSRTRPRWFTCGESARWVRHAHRPRFL